MANHSALITVMINAVRKAAGRLKRDYGEVDLLQVSVKGPADFVSVADLRTEQILVRELSRVRPDFGFLLEEGGVRDGADAERRWIVDPLDGTTNFLHGIPHFAISVALEEKGQLTAGVIYEPLGDQMFWAERGAGAHLNDRRLRVSARRDLSRAVVATGIPHLGREDHAAYLAQLSAVMPQVAGIRRFGTASLDLAYVAAGRFDGFWEAGLKPWDMAAGIVLVREAGGFVSDLAGGAGMLENGGILAANSELHQPLGDILRAADRASPADPEKAS
jgi:myo-inositol-1(or 4)-monophosphatase